jgi:glycosyltransferase involved in cell wall biosynthesis
MRIVQACGWYMPDSLGGTELYVSALARELMQAGHEVLVAAPYVGSGERRYAHEAVDVFRYPIPATPTRAEARGDVAARGTETFHRWLRDVHPDVVHFHTFVTGLGLREIEAAHAAHARVLVTSHAASLGFLCERGTMLRDGHALCDGRVERIKCAACALQHRGLPLPVAQLAARVPHWAAAAAVNVKGRCATAVGMSALIDRNQAAQQRLFDLTSGFVVLSEWAAEVMRANGAPADRVFVNRLGIDASRASWTRKPKRPTSLPLRIGFVGRAEAIKGLEDVVRAVASLSASAPVTLHIRASASSATERAHLIACRMIAGADTRIEFHDPLPPGEIPRVLADLDVLVCPSRAVEGGPTVALEAHAVGTPVVGAAMPALTEYVNDTNGALFMPGDWRELAACVRRIAADPANTVDKWRAVLQRPRTFAAIARDYLTLYEAA